MGFGIACCVFKGKAWGKCGGEGGAHAWGHAKHVLQEQVHTPLPALRKVGGATMEAAWRGACVQVASVHCSCCSTATPALNACKLLRANLFHGDVSVPA